MNAVSFLATGLIALLYATGMAGAQQQRSEQPDNAARLMVIAVGSVPPTRYKMPGAKDLEELKKEMESHFSGEGEKGAAKPDVSDLARIPIMLPPLPGEVPPGYLLVKTEAPGTKQAAEARSTKPVPVSFNTAGGGGLVPGGIPLRLFRVKENGGADDGESYLDCPPLAPRGQYVLILHATGEGIRRWEPKPTSRLMRLDAENFPANTLYIVNSSHQPVRFALGETWIDLPPGNGKFMTIERKGRFVRCAAKAANAREFLLNSALPADRGLRAFYVFHDTASPGDAGKSIGLFNLVLPETGTLPPQNQQ